MALLEEAARQLYREWFVRLRFPGHEHTRITNGVPEGWERALDLKLPYVLQRGFDLPVQNREDGDVPIYGLNRHQLGFTIRLKVAGPRRRYRTKAVLRWGKCITSHNDFVAIEYYLCG